MRTCRDCGIEHTGPRTVCKDCWKIYRSHPCVDCGAPCVKPSIRCKGCGQKNRVFPPPSVRTCRYCGEEYVSRCKCEYDRRKAKGSRCTECGAVIAPQASRCADCYHATMKLDTHPNWKNGRQVNKQGYVIVKLTPDDPMMVMAQREGYIREHRLVMARHLGRPLARDEVVHHINHDKLDNRIENLTVMTPSEHSLLHKRGDGSRSD